MKSSNIKNPIQLSGLLSATAPNKVFIAIVLGSLAGFAYALIIPVILMSIEPPLSILMQPEINTPYRLFEIFEISTPKLALTFFLICLFILICQSMSQILLQRIATDAAVSLRKKMYQRISQLPIQELERIGASRLLTALNNDIPGIVEGASVFPGLLVTTTTLIGLLGFLIYLNLQIFLFIIGVILAGAITYQIPIFFGERFLSRARDCFDGIQEGMRGLIYGAKELKLNQQKQQAFLSEDLHKFEDKLLNTQKIGDTLLIFGMTYGNLISFFAIGVVTYAMANYYSLSQKNLIGVVMVMLYVRGPISTLINSIGPIIQASVSAKKLNILLDEMPIEPSWGESRVIDCHCLHLKEVKYTYPTQKNEETGFQVGPFDLSLRRGEVTFLVGGNGSGKTTLSKLLSLHYIPQNGFIYFDDKKVTDINRESCRQSISAIYSDFYLFTKMFGIKTKELDQLAEKYIDNLELNGKVSIENGKFSSTDLSSGQKKRLALLVAYLENRSIYIFDEWAADQDPAFKRIFYHQILPSLKQMNKMVVVISHDDRYFHVADKIVRMENGKIQNVEISTDQEIAKNMKLFG